MKNTGSGVESGKDFHHITLKHDFRAALAALKILTRHQQTGQPSDDLSQAIDHALQRLDLLVAQSQPQPHPQARNSFNPLRNLGVLIENVRCLQKTRLLHEFSAKLNCSVTAEAAQLEVFQLGFSFPSELVRVLDNLCLNSGQAFLRLSTHSRAQRQVFLNVQRKEQWLSIQVQDNGPGLPHPLDQDPFLGHSIGPQGGSGIGLLFVRETIQKAGGVIRFESTAGRGTCFEILLPIRT